MAALESIFASWLIFPISAVLPFRSSYGSAHESSLSAQQRGDRFPPPSWRIIALWLGSGFRCRWLIFVSLFTLSHVVRFIYQLSLEFRYSPQRQNPVGLISSVFQITSQ